MGVFQDVINRGYAFDGEQPIVGVSSTIVRELKGMDQHLNAPGYPAGFDVEDEVQSLSANDATDGTFDLTVLGEAIDDLDHDVAAATLQTALDSALDGQVSGYQAGDIVVAGGDAGTNPITFTFSGDSVSGVNQPLITVDGTNLIGGTAGVVTQVTAGGSGRAAWAALLLSGAIAGTVPDQGADADDVVAGPGNSSPFALSNLTLEALSRQAAKVDDNPNVFTKLKEVLGF